MVFYSRTHLTFSVCQNFQGQKEFLISWSAEKEQLSESWVTLFRLYLTIYLCTCFTELHLVQQLQVRNSCIMFNSMAFPLPIFCRTGKCTAVSIYPQYFKIFSNLNPNQCGRCSFHECLNHLNISSGLMYGLMYYVKYIWLHEKLCMVINVVQSMTIKNLSVTMDKINYL